MDLLTAFREAGGGMHFTGLTEGQVVTLRLLEEKIRQDERERCVQAVREEPEYPDATDNREDYDQFVKNVMKLCELDVALGGTEFLDAVIRRIVRDTKKGIEERIQKGGTNAEVPARNG